MEYMPFLEMLHVLSGDKVDLSVPIAIKRSQLGKLFFLFGADSGKIFLDQGAQYFSFLFLSAANSRSRALKSWAFMVPMGRSSLWEISS